MKQQILFNQNLIVTNSAGEYYGIRQVLRFIATASFIQIGSTQIPYQNLLRIRAVSNQLFVQYLDNQGKSNECYLKYNPFFPWQAKKTLQKLVKTISGLMQKKQKVSTTPPNQRLATSAKTENNQNEVIVHSSKASFPPNCPICFKPATKITKLEVASIIPSSDFLKIGHWLVPTCQLHKNLGDALKVKSWSPNNQELTFTIKNENYAEAFLSLNQKPLGERNPKDQAITQQINRIKQNFKFVIYEYYISALVVSFLQLSDVHELKSNESKFFGGLKYNAVTLVAGWWSFPFGPVHTVIVLLKNFLGGVDVTEKVIDVYRGKPFSALED